MLIFNFKSICFAANEIKKTLFTHRCTINEVLLGTLLNDILYRRVAQIYCKLGI